MRTRREQIVDAAMQASQKDGVRSVSFRQLADEVGVKSASVHYHFPTKSDLAEDMVRRYTEQFEARLADISLRRRTLLGKIDALAQVFADVLARDDLCLCGMMAAELTAFDEKTRLALRHFFSSTEEWLRREIEAHRAEVRIELDAADLGKILLAGLEGAILLDRVDGRGGRLDAFRRMTRALLA